MIAGAAISPILPPDRRVFQYGLVAVLLLYLAVSPLMLDMFGWHYGSPSGSFIEKIHPASLLLLALFLLSAGSRTTPLFSIASALARHPNITVYLLAVAVLILQAIVILKQPFTTYVETFVMEAVAFFMLYSMSEGRGRRLALIIHAMFVVNSLLGIAEFVFQFRVTPFVIEGVAYEQEWRSSPLLGYPLSNALITACYVLALVLGGGRALLQRRGSWRFRSLRSAWWLSAAGLRRGWCLPRWSFLD